MSASDYINHIIQLAEPGGIGPNINQVARKSFGFGEHGISFNGNNVQIYDGLIKSLYQNNESIHNTYNLKRFESEFISFFIEALSKKAKISRDDSNAFFAKLLSEPVEEFSVLRDVHGLIIKDLQQPCTLGPFTIYHFPSHQNIINSKTNLAPEHIWLIDSPNYLIEVKTKARHFEKATEAADILFEKFELVLRFAIGFSGQKFEVGVLNYQGWRHRRAYIFSKTGSASSSHSNHGSFETIPIDDQYFNSVDNGFDRIWKSIASENITELQKRLLLAIEWIGQSYNEISPSSAFLKSAIALEILFTHNEKTLINASILSQISESIALLLGNSLDERLEIESKVKNLYSMRSAIAHAGKTQVAQEDLLTIFHLSRLVVMKIITNQSLKDLKSVSEVHAHLKSCKYSCQKI